MKFIIFILVVSLYSCTKMPYKKSSLKDSNIPELDITEVNLGNGFKALLIPNKKIPVYSLYMYYKVGSKYEKKGITGASHFLEHMMFKGAKDFAAGRFDYLIEGNGGQSNAYTNMDFTVYYEKMPSPSLEIMIKAEADRMQNLLLDEKAFESERNVILEERKMRYENSPQGKLYLAMLKEIQKGTIYSESVIGTIPDLKTVTRDQMKEYFDTYYTPNNSFMVLAGDFDVSQVKDWLEKYFSPIKENKKLEKIKESILKDKGSEISLNKYVKRSIYGGSPRPLFALAYPGVKIGTRDAYVLDIVASILGGGKSSYLNQYFVEGSRPKLSSIYAANYNLVHNGIFYITGELLNKVSINSFEKSLNKALGKFCNNEINERSLQKIKNQILVSTFSNLDTNSGLATYIGDREAYYGDWRIYQKELATYNEITLDETIKTCRKYLGVEGRAFISIWNKNTERVSL